MPASVEPVIAKESVLQLPVGSKSAALPFVVVVAAAVKFVQSTVKAFDLEVVEISPFPLKYSAAVRPTMNPQRWPVEQPSRPVPLVSYSQDLGVEIAVEKREN